MYFASDASPAIDPARVPNAAASFSSKQRRTASSCASFGEGVARRPPLSINHKIRVVEHQLVEQRRRRRRRPEGRGQAPDPKSTLHWRGGTGSVFFDLVFAFRDPGAISRERHQARRRPHDQKPDVAAAILKLALHEEIRVRP